MFQSKLISKLAKLKLYCPVIRPVVTYACETWTLKETITNRLMLFERNVLRKISGPTNENGIWQIKTNQELDKIIKHKNIIIIIIGVVVVIVIIINCNWVVTRWQWLFYMYTNMKKKKKKQLENLSRVGYMRNM